jgi:DNA-binding response OmpR family regulator
MQRSTAQRRALVVDDEPKIVEILCAYLRDEGFAVTGVTDGDDAMHTALAETFDVILLDLNLPTVSGVEIFKAVRKISDVPILMVTARDDSVDRIVGLELGADDYISKPFNPREVVARVKNIIGRVERTAPRAGNETNVERAGELEIDRSAHEVRLRGTPLKLTPTEYRIIDMLWRHAGAVLSRTQLLDGIGDGSAAIYDRTLDRHVANLRAKIGEDSSRPTYIHTVTGVGYKFAFA